jgi:hypothetical protein
MCPGSGSARSRSTLSSTRPAEPQARITSCGDRQHVCASRRPKPSDGFEPSTQERSLLSQALSASGGGLFRDAELDFFTRRNRPRRGALDPEPPVGKDRPGERAPPRRTIRNRPIRSATERSIRLPRLRSVVTDQVLMSPCSSVRWYRPYQKRPFG